MSMQDPISDMFNRIRNAQAVRMADVEIPFSTIKIAIAKVLQDEGYIHGFTVAEDKRFLTVELKYFEGVPVIARLDRVSRPGLRNYKGKSEIPKIDDGLGVAIVSTSKGVVSDRNARRMGLGGEILCYVS